jgi:hypothetical protein
MRKLGGGGGVALGRGKGAESDARLGGGAGAFERLRLGGGGGAFDPGRASTPDSGDSAFLPSESKMSRPEPLLLPLMVRGVETSSPHAKVPWSCEVTCCTPQGVKSSS